MEEADILASKIGIMSRGVLRCLGTPLHLKRRYGSGFKLTLAFKKTAELAESDLQVLPRAEALRSVESLLPDGHWRRVDQGGVQGSVMYEFDDQTANENKGVISSLLDAIDERKDVLGLEDWAVSQTSLEEVFLAIIKNDDAESTDK
jgi:ABC-type multidrug transport system ATPase subunit